jgi:hypothetical protein
MGSDILCGVFRSWMLFIGGEQMNNDMGRVIQGLCDAGHRETELYPKYGKENIAALAPTLEMADAWAKKESASTAIDTDHLGNVL